MSHWMFPNFLKDSAVYAEAQRHWESLWTQVLQSTGPVEPWQTQWLNNPFRDGNPIFSAVCRPLQRGVRIIQEEPSEPDDIELDWWLDEFGGNGDPVAIRELVIACCLSRENAARIGHLLRQWVQAGEVTLPTPADTA